MSKDIVDAWFRERLGGGPVARDTPAYNQVRDALPDLIARLDAAQPAPAPPKTAKAPKVAVAAAQEDPK
jgi:hypothetical protein